jgi:long-chain acyl-CoA synthetase
MKTLNDIIDRAAREGGSQTAIVTQEEALTYRQLHSQILRAAAGLEAVGIRRGDCVAIVCRNSPFFVISYFALARIGAVVVPINFMVQKPEELSYMLNDCRAAGIITQKEFLKGLRQAAAKCSSLKHLWVTDASPSKDQILDPTQFNAQGTAPLEKPFSELLYGPQKPQAEARASEEDTIGILYTSGTTGNPKGVMLTHKNLVTNCERTIERMLLGKSDVALCILPMFHTFAWTGNVLVSIRLGTKLVVSPAIAPAKPWLKLMGRHGVTLFTAVPQVYSVLSKEAVGFKGFILRWWFFRKVRMAISGAAPLSPSIQSAFESAFRVKIVEGFGLTETSPVATINTLEERKPGSVGRPIGGVTIKIIDDQERTLPPGQEGEICISGDNVMKGYFNLPEATREAFTHDGYFKTGDIGILDEDGFVFIRDRKKDMIIVKGLKVFSAQLEATLLEHPDIAEAAVIGIPDEHGDETIKAFIVLKTQATADKASLMQYCRQKFDPYKRPRDIELVSALPKNALQKVLKRTLRQQELEKKPAGTI